MPEVFRGEHTLNVKLNNEWIELFKISNGAYFIELDKAANCVNCADWKLEQFCDQVIQSDLPFTRTRDMGTVLMLKKDVYKRVCSFDIALLFWIAEVNRGNVSAGNVMVALAHAFIDAAQRMEEQ